ncbi:MAG: F0F1 ATP synthase subunit A [Eubacteriales bacterium]
MKKEKKKLSRGFIISLIVFISLIVLLLIGIILCGPPGEKAESIRETMRDGVLHEVNKVNFFGLEVNPSVVSAYTVSAVLLLFALILRIFVIPHFKYIPGRFQILIEKLVGFFDDLAKKNSPHRSGFVGAYIFSAGVYIFTSTVFELFGVQALTTRGVSISLPAPISDINAAIAMGFLSYFVILFAGIICGGLRGGLRVLKDFSLPISMSFRLFGALLSGLLVTELVYYYINLSFVLPVIVGVMFTLLHALIQTYVLTMLVSIFYGEAVEPRPKKEKKKRGRKKEKLPEAEI